MSLSQKIAYNVLVSFWARVVGITLALFTIGLTTRYLGQEGFGEYSTAIAFIFIFNSLADFGFYNILVREISKPNADESKIVSNILTLRILTLVLILGLGVAVGWFFPYSLIVKQSLFLIAVSYFFLSSGQILMGIFQKYLRTDKAAIAEIISRLFQFLLVTFFIYFDLGFYSVIWSLVLSSGFGFLLNVILSRKYIKFGFAFDIDFYKNILKESFPLAISGIFVLIYFKMDTILLSVLKSPADVGLYGAAYKILENLIFFPAMFVGVVMPLLSRFAQDETKDDFKKIFQKTLDILILTGVPLVAAGFFLAGRIMNLIAGSDFIEAGAALRPLLFAVFFIFLGTLFGNSIIALSKHKKLISVYGLAAVFSVTTNLILIPKYSYLAAALVTAMTEFLVTSLMFVLLLKTLKWSPSFYIFWKALAASAVMNFFIYFIYDFPVLLIIFFAFIIYCVAIYLFGGISKKDLQLMYGQ